MVKKVNESSDSGVTTKVMQDMFSEECYTAYHAMMKSLNVIKTLKIEINDFSLGSVKQSNEKSGN